MAKKKHMGMSEKEYKAWRKRMEKDWKPHKRKTRMGFGLFLLLVGAFWFVREYGYLTDIPFWPVVVILFALFLLTRVF